MIEPKPKTSGDDDGWQSDVIPRMCSCGMMLKKSEYNKHLKDGTHNKILGPKDPVTA